MLQSLKIGYTDILLNISKEGKIDLDLKSEKKMCRHWGTKILE